MQTILINFVIIKKCIVLMRVSNFSIGQSSMIGRFVIKFLECVIRMHNDNEIFQCPCCKVKVKARTLEYHIESESNKSDSSVFCVVGDALFGGFLGSCPPQMFINII